MESSGDLLRLRLVNHLLMREATKRLRQIQPPIQLSQECELKDFLEFAITRMEFTDSPFPFASFKLAIDYIGMDNLEEFAKQIGLHILRLSFGRIYYYARETIGNEVATLLFHMPNLTEIELSCDQPLYVSARQLQRMPLHFENLTVINVAYWNFTPQQENEIALLQLMISRSGRLNSFRVPTISDSTTPDMEILRFLLEKHGNNLPLLILDSGLRIHPDTLNVLQELMSMNVGFSRFSLLLYERKYRLR